MKIRYNLDNVQYTQKPDSKKDVPGLRVRLGQNTVETEPEELINAIERGQSFTPGAMTGTKSDTWTSQQIIVADIDNDMTDPEKYMTPEKAEMLLTFSEIYPYCMYYTFSNTAEHPKFRVMVILDRPITDAAEAVAITNRFAQLFNNYTAPEKCSDTAIKDNARLIYGTKTGSLIECDKKITSLDVMRKTLPEIEKPKTVQKSSMDWASPISERYNRDQFDLLEPLSFIPADEYEVWIKVGMCLKYEGYSVADWDAWSSHSSKYNPGDCEAKWDTFDTEKNTVTGGYIVNLAKYYGYLPPKDRPKLERTSTAAAREIIPDHTDADAPPEKASQDVQNAPEVTGGVQESDLTSDQILDRFMTEITSESFRPIPTGIDALDKALSGGLERKTLVTLAAAPGAGKTAIAQYIFENMAANDHNVVYVNLEMDKSQLLSRSISRLSHEYKVKNPRYIFEDVTALQVRRGYEWTDSQRKIVQNMVTEYRAKIAPHFQYVTTNRADPGHIDNTLTCIMGKLEAITAELIRKGQDAPLVCIDYLQFIGKDEDSKKLDNADFIKKILDELKNFALKYNTVVLVITANNRASNAEGRASMDSGRDTSNIEYSGDVMLSLVYTAVEEHWLRRNGVDKNRNDKTAYVDNDFIYRVTDWKLSQDTTSGYPIIAKLLSLKVVKGRSIESRRAAKFIYDGRYFYFEEDPGTENPYLTSSRSVEEAQEQEEQNMTPFLTTD